MKAELITTIICISIMTILVILTEIGEFTFTPLNCVIFGVLFFVAGTAASFWDDKE